MRKHILISIGIVISIVSCKQIETENNEITEQKSGTELKIENEKKTEKISGAEQYIDNDSLQTRLYFYLKKIAQNPRFNVEKKPIKNRHVDDLVDTIITLKFDKSRIESYKAVSEKWIYDAEIKNPEFKFLDSIRVGIKKEIFEKILKMELKSDLIKIGNMEQTSVFIFRFKNGTLNEINYDGYLD